MNRRGFISASLVIVALAACGVRAGGDPGKVRVLVVTGGHGFDRKGFFTLFQGYGDIEYREVGHPQARGWFAPDKENAYDVLVLYDMNQVISDEEKGNFLRLIAEGKGLVVLHHALADYQDWDDFKRIAGGKFYLKETVEAGVKHPPSGWKEGETVKVEIADPDHPITRGLEDFEIHDEVYSNLHIDPGAHVLLTTKHPLSNRIIGWARKEGKARIAGIQLGHDNKAYSHPSYRRIIERAIRWAAGGLEEGLGPDEKGYGRIFNGRNLEGWEAAGAARWRVDGGILIGEQGEKGESGDLFSVKEYDDFVLAVTFKMVWPGNSGVWFRYQSDQKAFQADILEWKDPVCYSGSLYCTGKMFIAMNTDPQIVNREGWNDMVIRAKGDHLVVELNGRKVADVRDNTSGRGRIGFQVHAGKQFEGMKILVRQVVIRPAG